MTLPTLTTDEQEYVSRALHLVHRVNAQTLKVLRETLQYQEDPNALTKSDVEFEVRVLREMLSNPNV